MSQSVPATMTSGQHYTVSVTLQNTGNTTWTSGAGYALGSQNPQDNVIWGTARVSPGTAVAPGQQYAFSFDVVAPAQGSYSMQWRMLQGARWFGGTSSAPVTVVAPQPPGETVTYVHTDGLGSPVARTDASGHLLSRTQYEPYGATAAGDEPTIGFTGHVNDADTGLVYMQQRYYDPVAGRFLSIDPVVTDANTGSSFNRYTYVDNNPYKFTDPDGRGPKGWVVILLKNGSERIGRALGSNADAVAARKAGENVVMTTKSGAKAVETAANSGDARNMLRHEGHDLPNGSTGRPHYQTEGSFGHTFWGKMSAVYLGFREAMEISEDEIWKDIKSDPVGAICWLCSAGNESNDSDKPPGSSNNPAVIAAERRRAEEDARCGVSCSTASQQQGRERENVWGF